MAITDAYVVGYLLQETAGAGRLRWMDTGSGEYTANLNGVTVRIGECELRTGRRLLLQLEYEDTTTNIWEPEGQGFFAKRFGSQEEERLAGGMRALLASIEQRRARREAERDATTERQEIYRRLLFAGPAGEG